MTLLVIRLQGTGMGLEACDLRLQLIDGAAKRAQGQLMNLGVCRGRGRCLGVEFLQAAELFPGYFEFALAAETHSSTSRSMKLRSMTYSSPWAVRQRNYQDASRVTGATSWLLRIHEWLPPGVRESGGRSQGTNGITRKPGTRENSW